MHVLVFPGWYPNRIDELSGDFIQRHMHAIAPQSKVTVVFPAKEIGSTRQEKVVVTEGGLTEYFYYYPSFFQIRWLDNLLSFLRYNYLCLKTAKRICKTEKVDLVHLYVLQKNYLLGGLLKWMYQIPYVVSEQSTIYVDGSFEKMNFIIQKLYQRAFTKASAWHGVSHVLVNTIRQKLHLKENGMVISNVVNTNLFYHQPHTNRIATFVHVSNMFYQKNVEGMLHAFAKVKAGGHPFVLNLVGPLPVAVGELIQQLNLQQDVIIFGSQNYAAVADIMRQSDVFVFFTRYETFGCVIVEANASGLPVIITNHEVTRELVADHKNGLFVENENVDDLAAKIIYTIHHLNAFDPTTISSNTRRQFNYDKIGNDFLAWYQYVLQCHRTG